jgi:CheY-like chemotaxis protein
VTTFAKPRDALDAMRGDPRRFDVAITDQSMPGMSGLDLARALSALNPELPIVLTSGNLLYPEHELRNAGVRRFLAKPYTGASLGDAIEAVLNRR